MRKPQRVEDLEINEMEDGFIIYDASVDKVHFLEPYGNVRARILQRSAFG